MFFAVVAWSWLVVPAADDNRMWSIGGVVTGKGKLKCFKYNVPQYHMCHKYHKVYHVIKPRPWKSEAGDWLPELWFGHKSLSYYKNTFLNLICQIPWHVSIFIRDFYVWNYMLSCSINMRSFIDFMPWENCTKDNCQHVLGPLVTCI
jgi:hypothetical protein